MSRAKFDWLPPLGINYYYHLVFFLISINNHSLELLIVYKGRMTCSWLHPFGIHLDIHSPLLVGTWVSIGYLFYETPGGV